MTQNKYHIIDSMEGNLHNSFNDIKEAPAIIRDIMVEYDVGAEDLMIVQSFGTLVIKDSIKLFSNDG